MKRQVCLGLFVVLLSAASVWAVSEFDSTVERRFDDYTATRRLKMIRESIEKLEENYAHCQDEIERIACVNMWMENDLSYPGETVRLHIEARSDKRPNDELILTQDHLAPNEKQIPFHLNWEKRGDTYVALWELTPMRTGNYLLSWKCDIGGDIPEFFRNFSVIDKEWTVLILNSNANGAHPPEKHLHKYRLPSNMFVGLSLWNTPQSAGQFLGGSRDARQYGDEYQVSMWLSNTYINMFDEEDSKLYEEHKDVQEAVFYGYKRFCEMMRLPRGADSIAVGSMSNEVLDSIRRNDYTLIGQLYADQNWADGGDYRINNWGMPARPFFMSTEDFRKCAREGDIPMVGIQQVHRQSCLCRDYNCVFSLEPGADYMMDRYSQYHRPRIITDVIPSREYDFVRCFVDTESPRKNPLFFTSCIEFAGFDWMPEMWQIQPLFIDYIAREVGNRESKFAVSKPHAVADFYRRHFETNPESVLYLTDMWAGRVVTGYDRFKPPIYPDTMEIENGTFRAILRKGETLPYVYYDYTKKWGYPYWGNDGIPRDLGGYTIPNTDDRFRCQPPIFDTRSMTVRDKRMPAENGTRVVITIESEVDKPDMTLAVWDLPHEYTDDEMDWQTNARRFIPIQAPFTDNFSGILVADIQRGTNTIELHMTSPPRDVKLVDLQLGEIVFAKVIERDGGAMAYLYNPSHQPGKVTINLPADSGVKLYQHATLGDDPTVLQGRSEFTIEPLKPQRMTGLTAEQLKAAVPGSRYFNPTVETPYCQINDCKL